MEKKIKSAKNKTNRNQNKNSIIKFVVAGVLILLLAIVYLNYKEQNLLAKQKQEAYKTLATIMPIPTPTLTPVPIVKPKPVVNTDPTIACNINANCGGGTRQMKVSDCKISTCCGLSDGSFVVMPNDQCNKIHDSYKSNNQNPSCTIYYPSLGYSKTYNLSPSDCAYWSAQASNNTNTVVTPTYQPLPTIDPNVVQQRIQTCQANAKSKYDTATSWCTGQASGHGSLDSSWYQQCVESATNTYDIERSECR